MDQATLALLQDGLRHVKGLVGVFERWIKLQKEKGISSEQKAVKKGLGDQ